VVEAAVERKRPMTKEDIQKKNLIKLINLMVQENEEQFVVGAAVERKRPMTKEDIQKMNLKKKTRKRTRKFEIDGVTVTTTTSKIIYR
jgi:hypothetical protein